MKKMARNTDEPNEPCIFGKNIAGVSWKSILSTVYPSSGSRMNFRGRSSSFQPLMHSCLSRIWKTGRLRAFRGDLRRETFFISFFLLSLLFSPSRRKRFACGKKNSVLPRRLLGVAGVGRSEECSGRSFTSVRLMPAA